jgi:predicted nuclease of predicted toxin-antitoxin system
LKLVIDMNLSPVWVAYLQERGIEAEHWSQIGHYSAPDEEIFSYCRHTRSVLLTHDLDFGAILARSAASGPSVVQLRADDLTPAKIGPAVVATLRQEQATLEAGAIITIDLVRRRIRALPLGPE